MEKNKTLEVYSRFEICPTRAKGVYLYDDHHIKYLDLYGGHGVISIGHGHPHYIHTIKTQLQKISYYSNSVQMPLQELLAQKLTKLSGYDDYRLFLVNSGAEANENALKLASFHTGRTKVISFTRGFHGRTAGALSVTDSPSIFAPINQHHFPVIRLPLNQPAPLIAALKQGDIAAVIIEGIQGIGGLDVPSDSFLKLLSKETKAHGTLLIIDEIQSGYGRSGHFFAHQKSGIQPDIISIAKGMGNGFPIGGILTHPSIKSHLGMLGTTFGGNHLACAAAISVLEVIETEDLLARVYSISQKIKFALSSIKGIKKMKGDGLMLGLEFDFPIKDLRRQLIHSHQIITGASSNPNLLRILPPLTIKLEEIQPFFKALEEILSHH